MHKMPELQKAFLGSMAGLAFGMIFLGMAVAGGVYFVLFR